MKRRHTCRKLSGVFPSPNPYTSSSCSRMCDAKRVETLSDETRQNPSKRPLCKTSRASITRATLDAFLPAVQANCCWGIIACCARIPAQGFRRGPAKSP